MQLTLENPDVRYTLRSADGRGALVNDQRLERSFILAPSHLVENWRPRVIAELTPEDLSEVLDLQPSVVLLGSGASLVFPATAVLAACLTRGVGMEVMDNAAAARTFNVLATEGRRVVAAFLL